MKEANKKQTFDTIMGDGPLTRYFYKFHQVLHMLPIYRCVLIQKMKLQEGSHEDQKYFLKIHLKKIV